MKKTSKVTTSTDYDPDTGELREPTDGIAIGKSKAITGSSRIREMLAGLNSEKD